MDSRVSTASNTNWNLFKSRLRARWKDLSDHELDRCRGSFGVLARIIERRFNESRDGVIDYIDNLWFEIYVRGSRHRFPQYS